MVTENYTFYQIYNHTLRCGKYVHNFIFSERIILFYMGPKRNHIVIILVNFVRARRDFNHVIRLLHRADDIFLKTCFFIFTEKDKELYSFI